jgi:PAS domain-containing protein
MASSEILLIAAGSWFLALRGPKCDLLAIVCVVLLARFRGRVQALIAASAFSLAGLGAIAAEYRFHQGFTGNGQLAVAVSAIWCCAFFTLSSKSNRGSARSSNNPFEICLDELTRYVWSRHADGSVEYVSPDGCEYLGVAPRDIQDFTRYIHPEDVDTRQRAMERVKWTGEPQQFRARYLAATGEYHWFATLLHEQKDRNNKVIRYFGLQWNIDDEKRKEDEMRARDDVWGTVLKIFPGWVWVSRPDGRLEFASEGARQYFGDDCGSVMGDGLALIHPDDRERRAETWKHLLELKKPVRSKCVFFARVESTAGFRHDLFRCATSRGNSNDGSASAGTSTSARKLKRNIEARKS